MLTRLARLGCGGSGNAGECRGAGGTYSERRYRFPISGRFRPTYPKRESDTGAALTRTRGSTPTPVLLAGAMRWSNSSSCSSEEETGRLVGGSDREAGAKGADSDSGCGNAKARESCRDAVPIRPRRDCLEADTVIFLALVSLGRKVAAGRKVATGGKVAAGGKAGGAWAVATAGSTTTGGLLGPPMARTDSVTLARGESNSRRKF